MTEAIIVAVITAAASILTQLLIASKSNSLMAYRIGELEKKVLVHNGIVERMTKAEVNIETLKEALSHE